MSMTPAGRGAIVAIAVLALVTGCTGQARSGHPVTVPVTQVSLGPGVSVTVAPTRNVARLGLHESAAPPGAATSLTGSAFRALHEPVLITATSPLPVGTRLAFTVPAQPSAQAAETVLLASYDPSTGRWTPVPATWNANRTVISAVVPHFSTWAPITWVTDRLKAAVVGAFSSVFGPLMTHPTAPACDSSANNFLIDDSVLNDSVQTCVQVADRHAATVKLTNTRNYAIDLLTPSAAHVTTTDPGSVATRIGAALTAWLTRRPGVTRTLLPPHTSATITLPLDPGTSKTIRTEIDNEAWAVSTLDTALSEVAFVYGHLASATFSHPDPTADATFINNLLTDLSSGKCMLRAQTELNDPAPLTLDTARTIGSVMFDCISAIAADQAGLVFASAVGVIVGLGDALIQAIIAGLDTVMSQSLHIIRIDRINAPQPKPPAPGTKNVTIAPVKRAGAPAAGWSVKDETGGGNSVDCSGNYAAEDAPVGDVYYCSPTAASADTCFRASDPTQVLCLQDPFSHTVALMPADPAPNGPAVRSASDKVWPIGLVLGNGDHCRLRNGGSWGVPAANPNLRGFYTCTIAQAVWGPFNNGIDKSNRMWTVLTGGETGPLTKRDVIAAYYVAPAP